MVGGSDAADGLDQLGVQFGGGRQLRLPVGQRPQLGDVAGRLAGQLGEGRMDYTGSARSVMMGARE